jgi:hypothetical protein
MRRGLQRGIAEASRLLWPEKRERERKERCELADRRLE